MNRSPRGEALPRRQRSLVTVVFLAMIAEGLDITIPGFVYPQLVRDWGTSLGAVTATVTIGVLAMAVGGAVAGPLADRHDRRPVALAGIALFGLATAGMGLAGSIEVFALLRIVACVGLGATMPVVLAVVADSVPPARRSQLVTLSFSGVAVGTILGGFLSAAVIPTAGWAVLLVLCGGLPLLLLPAVHRLFDATPAGAATGAAAPVSTSVSGAAPSDAGSEGGPVSGAASSDAGASEDAGPGAAEPSVAALVLSRQMLPTTLLVWWCFFLGLGVVFLILNYLPLMVEGAGFSAGQAGVLVALFGWGGLVGQLLAALALRRLDRFRLLAALWAVGALGVWAVAVLAPGFGGLAVLVVVIGVALPGANGVLQAIGALAYPPRARATGMGWTSGVGRLGTLTSGLLGGLMLGTGWGLGTIFATIGLPVAVGAAGALALRRETRRSGADTPVSTSPSDAIATTTETLR